MKLKLSVLSFFVAFVGILSFIFLVVAIGTDFWYIIDASKLEIKNNISETMSSHSGLWRMCKFKDKCSPLINPFWHGNLNFTDPQKQLLTLVTLTGISIYIAYSAAAFNYALFSLGSAILSEIDIRFGWSLALAWISFITEVLTGMAFLLAARVTGLKRTRDQVI
ncbi:transmembrane protein 114 isoform X2 [Hyla sarda]|uniref:transmembrane protein 114 isoform X2 n=1 Tax=Hyla sarda TaxID=327740 RepID=UPI0024C29239|nr:transmembrane protein 114 isoform X2 [Hyla sarda]